MQLAWSLKLSHQDRIGPLSTVTVTNMLSGLLITCLENTMRISSCWPKERQLSTFQRNMLCVNVILHYLLFWSSLCSFYSFYRTYDYDSKMFFVELLFLIVDPKKGNGQLFYLIKLFSICSFILLESYHMCGTTKDNYTRQFDDGSNNFVSIKKKLVVIWLPQTMTKYYLLSRLWLFN